jgi:oxygen-independent coproporphyrinogen-3 oxidase
MDRLKSRFDVAAAAEIAIEIDPRHFSQALADAFKTSGITRASLGVQTFDEDVQAAVNRVQSADTVAQCVDLLRSAGVSDLNFDLIYGLPLQTVESCRMTAREALRFSPDRFSVFGYAHVPHFKAHQRMIRDDDLPDVSSRLNQACAIAGELTQAGYIPIGLDHFAKPDDSLALAHAQRKVRRNFQGYTTDDAAAIIGFGPSAVGWLPQGYVQNSPATPDWERRIEAGELPIARGRRLTAEDRFRGEIIERLMCDLEADIAAIAARHGFPQPESDFSAFIESGIVTADASLVRVNREYRPLVRNIAAVFDAYLLGSTAQYSLAV